MDAQSDDGIEDDQPHCKECGHAIDDDNTNQKRAIATNAVDIETSNVDVESEIHDIDDEYELSKKPKTRTALPNHVRASSFLDIIRRVEALIEHPPPELDGIDLQQEVEPQDVPAMFNLIYNTRNGNPSSLMRPPVHNDLLYRIPSDERLQHQQQTLLDRLNKHISHSPKLELSYREMCLALGVHRTSRSIWDVFHFLRGKLHKDGQIREGPRSAVFITISAIKQHIIPDLAMRELRTI